VREGSVNTIRVLIADDHPVFRSGIRAILEGEPDTEVVGEAATADASVSLAKQHRPDVVVMDLHMPGIGGIEATRRIVAAGLAKVLVVTMLEDDATVVEAVRAGAAGYVLKGAGGPELLRALRAVASGETIFGASVAPGLVSHIAHVGSTPTGATPFGLTERELEIIELIARGLTNDAIAERIFLSPKTVRNYVSAIFSKLDVESRAEVVARARDAGFGGANGERR
jgi:DNA-binding NarL/FixJ family response regulator